MRCRKTFHYIQRIDSAVVWHNLNPLNSQQSNQNRNQTTPDKFLFHSFKDTNLATEPCYMIIIVYTRVKCLKYTRVGEFVVNLCSTDIMDTKLTLTLNKDVIEYAKKYAATNQTSLSDLVENYFKALTASEPEVAYKIKNPSKTPIVDSLVGSAKSVELEDLKTEKIKRLEAKYLS